MDEVPTFISQPLPDSDDYPPLHRAYGLLQWLNQTTIPEQFVVLCETDQIFLRPMPNLVGSDMRIVGYLSRAFTANRVSRGAFESHLNKPVACFSIANGPATASCNGHGTHKTNGIQGPHSITNYGCNFLPCFSAAQPWSRRDQSIMSKHLPSGSLNSSEAAYIAQCGISPVILALEQLKKVVPLWHQLNVNMSTDATARKVGGKVALCLAQRAGMVQGIRACVHLTTSLSSALIKCSIVPARLFSICLVTVLATPGVSHNVALNVRTISTV
jgi:hypothetical protein